VPGISAVGNRPLARSIGREGPAGTIGVERLRVDAALRGCSETDARLPTSTPAPCLREKRKHAYARTRQQLGT
jgi:hypothetical protein